MHQKKKKNQTREKDRKKTGKRVIEKNKEKKENN
jgi:hypothetical protein